MSFVLKVTDGETEVDFMGLDFHVEDGGLQIEPPSKKQVWGGDSIFADGGQLVASTYKNRDARIKFALASSSRDGLAALVSELEALLRTARNRYINGYGSRVELQYKWDELTNITYFEVLDGEFEFPNTILSVGSILQFRDGRYVIEACELKLVLRPVAYSVSPVNGEMVALPLSNSSGSDVTTGLTIYNHFDVDHDGEDHDNFVEISGDDLPGDHPLPVKIEIENLAGHSEKVAQIVIGVRSRDLDFRHVLEDGDADYLIGSATPTADVDYSSGESYTQLDFTTEDGEALAKWDLTAEEIDASQGAFRVFGRCKSNEFWDDGANYCLVISFEGTILYQSEWISPLSNTVNLFDLGTIYLPPWLGNQSGLAGLTIELWGRLKEEGSSSLKLDYLMLMPQDSGYRVLKFRGDSGMAQLDKMVDDSWEEAVYFNPAAKAGIVVGLMRPIFLEPGKTQRLYFLHSGTAGSSEIERTLKIKMWAVPAYKNLA